MPARRLITSTACSLQSPTPGKDLGSWSEGTPGYGVRVAKKVAQAFQPVHIGPSFLRACPCEGRGQESIFTTSFPLLFLSFLRRQESISNRSFLRFFPSFPRKGIPKNPTRPTGCHSERSEESLGGLSFSRRVCTPVRRQDQEPIGLHPGRKHERTPSTGFARNPRTLGIAGWKACATFRKNGGK